MEIEHLISAIRGSQVRISNHADDDDLTYEEIYFSVLHGEVIETYLNDNLYPSCLVFGRSFSGESIHTCLSL
ncbi:DUF4258 domain-containing protein [Methyloprofundus sp.]|uniref:DUF4258 domain-containing protein n=1 Tax=Methyloprofundus sp. TaxID=2020875 RepID=UPI003431355B